MSIIDCIAWLAAWCGRSMPTIALLTGITAGVLAAVILYLRRLVLLEENWARYFGWAFAVFSVQYIIQAIAGWTVRNNIGTGTDWEHFLQGASLLSQAVFSPVNNLCFLASARALLARKKAMRWYWVIIAFITSLLGTGPQTFLYRLPDAMFSLYCLGKLGWAMFRNFSPRRRPWLASANLFGAGLYGLLNIAFAFNPVLSQKEMWGALSSQIENVPGKLTVLFCLDALVFAIAFGLKLLLFLGALLLIIKLLLTLSPVAAKELLKEVRDNRTQYLETRGIVRALALSVEADLGALYISLPGRIKAEVSRRLWLWEGGTIRQDHRPTLLRLAWSRYWQTDSALQDKYTPIEREEQERVLTLPLPSEESILGTVLRTGQEFISHSQHRDRPSEDIRQDKPEKMRAVAIVPIRYHGAVVGCLDFEWREPFGYSATALQRIRHAADWLAPAVHTRRQLVALDRLTERFRTLEIADQGTDGRIDLAALITEVHDILSPLETSCIIDFGFSRNSVVCTDQGCSSPAASLVSGENINIGESASWRRQYEQKSVEMVREPLVIKDLITNQKNSPSATISIGELAFALARHRDPHSRPALVSDHLLRRTVASILADAVFDAARRELGILHNRLQLEFNSNAVLSIKPWLDAIQRTIIDAGLTWAVVAFYTQEPSFIGDPNDRELIRGLYRHQQVSPETITLVSLTEPHRLAWHVIALPLRETQGHLWLGVAREGFGQEINFLSPWRTFLDRLSRSADSALVRIEQQRLQLKAKQLELVAIKVETPRLLLHELDNVTAALEGRVQRIKDSLPKAGVPVPLETRDRVLSLKSSLNDFRKLVNSILRPVPDDSRSSIYIREAVSAIRTLYEERFKGHDIQLNVEIDPELAVAVPLETAYLALSNVILNAADAINRHGTISIKSEATPRFVLIHITDDGPGIPPHLREEIFELTFTTKLGGSGLGLPLARSAMKRFGGELTLTESLAGATRFTLCFPKFAKET